MSALTTIACPKPSRFIPLEALHLHESPKAVRPRPIPLPLVSPRSASFAPYPSPTIKTFTPKRSAHTLHRQHQSITVDVSKWADYQPQADDIGPISSCVKSRTIKHISTSPYTSKLKVDINFKAYRDVQPISPVSPVGANLWRPSSPPSPASTTIDLHDMDPPRMKRRATVELPPITPPAHSVTFATPSDPSAADAALLRRVTVFCQTLQAANHMLTPFASPVLRKHSTALINLFEILGTALSSPSWTPATLGLDIGEADRTIGYVSGIYETLCGQVTQGNTISPPWEDAVGEAVKRMKRLTHMGQ